MKEIQREEIENSDEDSEKVEVKVNKNKRKSFTVTDIMKKKLDKLMAKPDQPVFIPEPVQERDVNTAQEFDLNVRGSSAGAGSGEFHLYRQMRRKEANRQAILGYRKRRDDLNAAYHEKLEENEKTAEEKTAKKREKRQKKKANKKKKKNNPQATKIKEESEDEDSVPDSDEDQEEKIGSKDLKVATETKPTSKREGLLMKEPTPKPPIVIEY